MHCDVCKNRANTLWASADVAGSPMRVCGTCIDEEMDLKFKITRSIDSE